MLYRFGFILAMLSALLSSGCSTMSNSDKGAIVGGLMLGVVGSQIGGGAGRIASTLLFGTIGAQMGHSMGESMDSNDARKANYALEYKRNKEPMFWHNSYNGMRYEVTPVTTYYISSIPCRDFVIRAKSRYSRQYQNIHTRACRQGGEWVVR